MKRELHSIQGGLVIESGPLSPKDLLNLRRLPARLNMQSTAILLGFNESDIPILMSNGIITPLGNPAQNAPKWFSAKAITELAQDERRLALATKTVYRHWQKKNKAATLKRGSLKSKTDFPTPND